MTIKETPILFSTPMVQAILDERKTQTRRVLKKQPVDEDYRWWHCKGDSPFIDIANCPYGQIGDRLWVRESYSYYHSIKDEQGNPKIAYKADIYDSGLKSFKWKPSIHMPRSASRITLEITDICVEQLQDISEEDCLSEGINYQGNAYDTIGAFSELWDSINVKNHTWNSNPYVWVIEFKMIQPPFNESLSSETV